MSDRVVLVLSSAARGLHLLNFVASHDGIGLRPAEGLLDAEQLDELIHCVELFGGRLTQRARPDGSLSPYEANIALLTPARAPSRAKTRGRSSASWPHRA